MPKITVIVPVYKVEPYLRRCVDSILNQTFTDFELILVDDGSPDGCGVICDEYIDPRITVIHQPNGGLSAARNSGIDWAFACSDSEWLGFVDSDDWVHPKYLDCLFKAVKENNARISICEYIETDDLTREDGYHEPAVTIADGIDFFVSDKSVIATVAWNKLYQKKLFTNIRYPVGKIHEDEFVTYKLLFKAVSIAYVKAALYFYYVNPQGITKSTYSLKRLDAVEGIEAQCQFFKELGDQEYYAKWVKRLIKDIYPSHMTHLKTIGEKAWWNTLRKRGLRLAYENKAIVSEFSTAERDNVWAVYCPCLNRIVMPLINLARMLSRGGIREAVRYYRQKFTKR